MADLEYRVERGIGTILLNRPRAKNAFTMEMIADWAEVLRAARTDPTVRVVVLTGAGGAFCAGADLSVLALDSSVLANKQMLSDHIHRIALELEGLDKPVIAAVNGVAVGAGMDMALMCDIRLASQSARFSEGYVKVGLVPGDGGCYYLPRLVGIAKALELLWTGDTVDAVEARRIGLVNHVYADSEFHERSLEFASTLAAAPPVIIQMIKRATYQSARTDLHTALDLISSHMAVARSTRDSAEAMSAFREGRLPTFTGE